MRKVPYLSLLFILTVTISGGANNIDKKIDNIIKKLTLEEKARLLVGDEAVENSCSHIVSGAAGWTHSMENYGIPAMNLADGPVGIRINPVASDDNKSLYDENGIPLASTDNSDHNSIRNNFSTYCTCFPSTTALAATWSKESAYRQGQVMGKEGVAYGVDVILTPGINTMRNPLCGRNFEYFSEDPVISGKMAAAFINGVQENGIGTSLKHFIANNQQTGKKENDARMTQRALREIYAKGFEIAVKESSPWTVMGSYNRISGEYTQANHELLTRLLRDEWGYEGLVITDWNITFRRPTIRLINARCALIMPGEKDIVQEIIDGVNNGQISEKQLNNCVKDVLRLAFKSISANGFKATTPDLAENAKISREVATDGMVLLKNEDKTLPLPTDKKVALFGVGGYHTIAGGTGSSNVNKAYIIDISEGMKNTGYKIDTKLEQAYNAYVESQNIMLDKPFKYPEWQKLSYHRVETPEMSVSKASETIKQSAENNDAAIIVISRPSGETSDRRVENDLNLTDIEQELIDKVSNQFHAVDKKVAVILNICGIVETASWRDKVDAILVSWFPGQEAGNAVADIISGKANPSGRLPMTFPIEYTDLPSSKHYPYIGQTSGENFDYTVYDDDIWVGYRYFNTTNRPVAYPFGYGLSYTSFDYTNMKIKRINDTFKVTVDIYNKGKIKGAEVVQLYISAPDNKSVSRPKAELKGFTKTPVLKPGEQYSAEITLSIDDLAWFDESNSQWVTEAGDYIAYFGNSVEFKNAEMEFNIGKEKKRKVLNILAPVVKVKPIDIESLIIK